MILIVILHQVKLTTWDHLNFSILLRTSTRLYTIVEKIKERHGGSVKDISLYKHQVQQKLCMSNTQHEGAVLIVASCDP